MGEFYRFFSGFLISGFTSFFYNMLLNSILCFFCFVSGHTYHFVFPQYRRYRHKVLCLCPFLFPVARPWFGNRAPRHRWPHILWWSCSCHRSSRGFGTRNGSGFFLSTWPRCLSGIVCGAALSIARALRPILFSCSPLLLRCWGTFTKLASSCSRNAKKVFHKAKAGELFPEVPDRLAVEHIVRDGQVQKAHETKAVAYLKLRRVIRDVVVALKDQDFEHQQVIIGSAPPCLWPAWLVHPSKAPEGLKINVLTQAL